MGRYIKSNNDDYGYFVDEKLNSGRKVAAEVIDLLTDSLNALIATDELLAELELTPISRHPEYPNEWYDVAWQALYELRNCVAIDYDLTDKI